MKWIDVKDELPEKAGQYLASNGMAIVIASWNGSDWFHIGKCTHWMNLPELPEPPKTEGQ